MDVSLDSLNRLSRTNGDDTKAAAAALEAYFLRQVLAEVRGTDGGSLDGGFAGSTFREMLDEALANAMAGGGGLGLAAMMEKSFSAGAAPAAASPRTAPAPVKASAVPHGTPHGRAIPMAGHSHARAAYRGAAVTAAGPLTEVPVGGVASSPFGRRTDPIEGDSRYHSGLDVAAPLGTPVRSAGSGRVVQAGPAGGYGQLVVVDHGNGLQTRYGHLSEILVKEGQELDPGHQVGKVGATGRATGPHLHFEVRRNGQPIDPKSEISGLKFLK